MSALAPHPALQRRSEDVGPALCALVSDWTGKVPFNGALVEPKIDGMRALYCDGELFTREGSTIHGVDHILAKLRAIEHEAAVPLVIDGEWQVGGSFAATIAHFKAAGARGDAGVLHVFDLMPARVWRGEDVCEALHARRAKLDRLLPPFVGDELRLVPWAYMTDAADIEARARELIAAGGEGVVVKAANSTYRRAKGTIWQRIRKSLTIDAPIVGWTPQRGNEDMLGALVLNVEGVRVHVAAGFSDQERRELWLAREGLKGEFVEVDAMERTERGSLRQAVYRRMRPDKGRVRI
jgi:ATP-dependent DNA ligase